jgi:rhodanese-related sulfurtransferase
MIMRWFLVLAAVLALAASSRAERGIGAPGVQIDAPRITQQEFKKLIAARNVVIVDTRVEDVFELGHIPGALRLPLEGRLTWPDEYEKTVQILLKTKKPVVTYCA